MIRSCDSDEFVIFRISSESIFRISTVRTGSSMIQNVVIMSRQDILVLPFKHSIVFCSDFLALNSPLAILIEEIGNKHTDLELSTSSRSLSFFDLVFPSFKNLTFGIPANPRLSANSCKGSSSTLNTSLSAWRKIDRT